MWYLGIFFFCLSRVAREKDSKGGGERNSPCSCPRSLSSNLSFFCVGGENWQGIKAYKAMRFLTQSRRNEISVLSLLLDKTRLSLDIIESFKLLLRVAFFFPATLPMCLLKCVLLQSVTQFLLVLGFTSGSVNYPHPFLYIDQTRDQEN